jgi:hypothetical protein
MAEPSAASGAVCEDLLRSCCSGEVVERAASRSYGAAPAPEVSVVVATHDRAGFLTGLLGALGAQTFEGGAFEVVVVDDCSSDQSWPRLVDAVAGAELRLLCLRLGRNLGSGAARTVGLRHCRAPVVAFTDDDCLPSPQWLERLTAPWREGAGLPRSLVVQGRTVPWPEDAEAAGPWARTLWVLRPTWLFETCNIAYRRVDLEAVGGFPSRDETPPAPSGRQVGEDALTGWRVIDAGGQLVFAPDALVHHRNMPASYGDWLRDQLGRAVFPALVARSPWARRAFWCRWFLTPRSAAVVLGALSVALVLVRRRVGWAAGVAPWVALALPEARSRGGRSPAVRLAQLAVVDVVGLAATARASLRHRRLVL